jgi:hypothetical protein
VANFTDKNISWTLPIITVVRYVFMALTIIGFTVWSFDAQNTLLGAYFSDRLTDSFFKTYVIFEACYWALKYKKLLNSMKTTTKCLVCH